MKTILSLLFVFLLSVFLLPLVAIGSDKTPAVLHTPPRSSSSQQNSSENAVSEQTTPAQSSLSENDDTSIQTVQTPYPKEFLILDRASGETAAVPVLEYIYGAVAAELPPTFHSEALKAQAVASHSYALYCHQNRNPSLGGADFSANPQNWEGYITKEQMLSRYPDTGEAYWKIITDAVDQAANEIICYADAPILAAYHSMSSGSTEYASNVWNGSLPYLVPVASEGDCLAPGYESTVHFSAQQLKEVLQESFPSADLSGDPREWLQIVSRSPSGYVLQIQMGNMQISGLNLRSALGLRSSNFQITPQSESVVFTTYGYGHGVGLSQYGADFYARQGLSYREILEHYYPGAALRKLALSS